MLVHEKNKHTDALYPSAFSGGQQAMTGKIKADSMKIIQDATHGLSCITHCLEALSFQCLHDEGTPRLTMLGIGAALSWLAEEAEHCCAAISEEA